MENRFENNPDILLGPDDAQDDPHILEYFVESSKNVGKPIVVGGWGSGKSALLLEKSEKLLEFLHDTNLFTREIRRTWYIVETDLDIVHVSDLIRRYDDDSIRQSDGIYKIWNAEIIRRLIIQLDAIEKKSEVDFSGNHWDVVKGLSKRDYIDTSIWKRLREIISENIEKSRSIINVIDSFSDITSGDVHDSINACVRDVKFAGIPAPIVLVEPVERPTTLSSESSNFINFIVSILLDVWYDQFRAHMIGNEIEVYLTIPWHRYEGSDPKFPQKIGPYTSFVRWERDDLDKVIRKRLVWQAKQFGLTSARFFSEDSIWHEYFPPAIENRKIKNRPNAYEDTFNYILRHTCWRPKDLLNICRSCIVKHCQKTGTDLRLFFTRRDTIHENTVREVVAAQARQIANWRIAEFDKKYNLDLPLIEIFAGMESPIEYDLFIDRTSVIPDITNVVGSKSLLTQLWDADVLGVCVEVLDHTDLDLLVASYGEAVIRRPKNVHRDGRSVLGVLFLYKYNTPINENPISLIHRYAKSSYVIFHPIFHEYFGIVSSEEYPVGV